MIQWARYPAVGSSFRRLWKLQFLFPPSVDAFRNDSSGPQSVLQKYTSNENENLLVGAEVPDLTDIEAVVAFGYSNTKDVRDLEVSCVLSTMKERPFLTSVGGSLQCFEGSGWSNCRGKIVPKDTEVVNSWWCRKLWFADILLSSSISDANQTFPHLSYTVQDNLTTLLKGWSFKLR